MDSTAQLIAKLEVLRNQIRAEATGFSFYTHEGDKVLETAAERLWRIEFAITALSEQLHGRAKAA